MEYRAVGLALVVASAALSVWSGSPLWRQEGILLETVPDGSPVSAARWLWAADLPVTNGATCYFRHTFTLRDEPVNATFNVDCDDRGGFWLNGRSYNINKPLNGLVKGRNVLAVKLENGSLEAGVIINFTINLKDGSTQRVCSSSAFKSSATAPEGWQAVDFDDSSWKNAVEEGDVWAYPWNEARNLVSRLATAEECAEKHRRDYAFCTDLPADLEQQPDPTCSIVYEGNRPRIRINGHDYPALVNLVGLNCAPIVTANIKSSELGFKFHELQFATARMERPNGKYDFSAIDLLARRMVHYLPDDYLFLRFEPNFPMWCAAHPDECIKYLVQKKGDEYSGSLLRPSAASLEYRRELTRFFEQLGAYVKDKPWRKRIAGVRVCWGVYTEWHTYGMHNGPDVGPAMMKAFHAWKGGKWSGAEAPTMAERRRPGLMLDPVRDEKTIDYFECLNSVTRSLLIHMLKNAKRALPGRLAGAYWGYVLNAFPPEGQNCILEGLLDSPYLDFCSNPSAYSREVRQPGGTYHERTIPDAFRRRNKLAILEDDMRFHHVRKYAARQYATKDAEESRAVMARNYLLTAFEGCGLQLCDPFGGRYHRANTFDHPSIWGAMHEAEAALCRAGRVSADSGNTFAVVVSPRERLRWASPIEESVSRHVSAYLPQYVHASGVAADFITLEDFIRTDRKWARVVFPDEVTLDEAEIAALKIRLDGSKSVWFMREPPIAGANHIKAAHIPAATREVSHGSREWAELAKSLGEHLWTEPGKCLRKQGDLVMMSLPGAGEYHLELPTECDGATEMFGGKSYSGRHIVFSVKGPDVVLFKLNGCCSCAIK